MNTEQRTTARKLLKVKAVLALEGLAPVLGKTTDIGTNGVSITVANPMQAGHTGQLYLDLLIDGKVTPMQMRARVMYCIFSGGDYKVGFQFLNPDLKATGLLARFLR